MCDSKDRDQKIQALVAAVVIVFLQLLTQNCFQWCSQYLRLARELTGYGAVVFPHCCCDSRKEGHVIASVGAASFKLQACREDGALEVKLFIYLLHLKLFNS
jgi:hypothetical protein